MKHFFTCLFILTFFVVSNSYAQINWTKHSDPVLTPGPVGEWDEEFVGMPSVLFDGSTYHMWYSNYNHITGKHEKIGYATSTDGIMWIKYDNPATTNPPYAESDPVLLPGSPGTYDDEGLYFTSVLLINSIYHMWYGASDDPAFAGHISICYATSPNGISWTKNQNNPVLDVGSNGTWDDVWLAGPCVVFDGSMYHMWYHAWDGNGPPDRVRIGHATSPDPDGPWTKDPDNPVLDIGSSGSWDYDRVDAPGVVFDGKKFHMFYSGGMFTAWRIGYAWSSDGSNWTKYNNNPVLEWGTAGTFDDLNVSHCSVILDSTLDTLKMWYLAGDSVYDNHYSCQIGYATSFFDPPDAIGVLNQNFPYGYELQQNYPNPFNPVTMIIYQLPMTSAVELSIYNLLGQKVTTLVNKKQSAGSYEVQWDASGFSSGVYLYRLSAGTFIEVKKLVLIK